MQGVSARDGGFQGRDGLLQGAQARVPVQALPGRTFRCVDDAVRWAFVAVEQSAAKVANYVPTVAGTGDRMTPLEIRAQAALIIASIMALPQDQADYMVAAYAWRDVEQALVRLQCRAKRQMPPGLPDLTVAMVERHIRSVRRMETEGLRLVAARHGVSHKVARTRDEKVRAWLGEAWQTAEASLLRKWELTMLIHQ